MYPTLEVGDKVKIMRKNSNYREKKKSHWLKDYCVVQEIAEKLNQTYYKLTDYPSLLMRHELLKI